MNKAIYSKEHNRIIQKLQKARKETGLDQKEVANKLGRSQSYVSKVESGQRRIDVLQLKDFAKIYKKKLSFFVK